MEPDNTLQLTQPPSLAQDPYEIHQLVPGTNIGRYVVLHHLGAGGMGVVYAAYDPELERKVALKLVRAKASDSQGTETTHARLHREAQAMARLSHPNVVSVYDVGTVNDEIFVAMEYIEGGTLKGWLQEKQRSLREVMDVFIRAGRGLAAAHRAGIVHRDFKPDNILMADDGRVCVTDFGLAHQEQTNGMRPELIESTLDDSETGRGGRNLTEQGSIMGTPPYMAPEQHRGEATDPSTDQFSFCVALYEALYGVRPFAGKKRFELLAAIEDGRLQEPKNRRGSRRIRDLVVRGLRPDAAQRHASMDVLLAALERQRSRRKVTWAAVGAAALAAGFAGFGYAESRSQTPACLGGSEHVAEVWNGEVSQRVRQAFLATGRPFAASAFDSVEDYLQEYTSSWSSMHQDACEDTRVRGEQSERLMDLRMSCLDRQLEEVDALIAQFSEADDKTVERAVSAVHSLPPMDRCEDTDALLSAVEPPQDADVRRQVDAIRKSLAELKALMRTGHYGEAKKRIAPIVEQARSTEYDPVIAEALYRRGDVQDRLNEADDARKSLLEAMFVAEAVHHDPIVLDASHSLVYIEAQRGNFDEAKLFQRHSEALLERTDAPAKKRATIYMHDGVIALTERDNERAMEVFARVVEILKQEATDGPTPGLARATANLAIAYRRADKLEKALELNHRALEDLQTLLGETHPHVSTVHINLGGIYAQLRHLEKARQHLDLADEIWKEVNPDGYRRALAMSNAATVALTQGRYEDALALAKRSRGIVERLTGPKNHQLVAIIGSIGDAYRNLGQLDRAEQTLAEVAALIGEIHPDDPTERVGVLRDQAALMLERGDAEQALAKMKSVATMAEEAWGADDARLTVVRDELGAIAYRAGEIDLAREQLRKALELARSNRGESPALVPILVALARAHLAAGDHEQARRALDRAEPMLEPDQENPELVAQFDFARAQVLSEAGDSPKRAKELAWTASKIYQGEPHTNRDDAAAVEAWLAAH